MLKPTDNSIGLQSYQYRPMANMFISKQNEKTFKCLHNDYSLPSISLNKISQFDGSDPLTLIRLHVCSSFDSTN